MGYGQAQRESDQVLLMAVFARIDNVALSVAFAVVGAAGLALATTVLLIAGPSATGLLGPNLSALATFLPGYDVTWFGAVVGAAYGGLMGAASGFLIALFWNFSHLVFLGLVTLHGYRP
jgi:hypothetical protein